MLNFLARASTNTAVRFTWQSVGAVLEPSAIVQIPIHRDPQLYSKINPLNLCLKKFRRPAATIAARREAVSFAQADKRLVTANDAGKVS